VRLQAGLCCLAWHRSPAPAAFLRCPLRPCHPTASALSRRRLWSREVQANLSVYRGHMLPGGPQHTPESSVISHCTAQLVGGIATAPAAPCPRSCHPQQPASTQELNTLRPRLLPRLQCGTCPPAPTFCPTTLPRAARTAPRACGAPTARSRCACLSVGGRLLQNSRLARAVATPAAHFHACSSVDGRWLPGALSTLEPALAQATPRTWTWCGGTPTATTSPAGPATEPCGCGTCAPASAPACWWATRTG